MKKALVVLSGGQDSTTCLFLAKLLYDEVEAITFSYGQRHSSEQHSADLVVQALDVNLKRVDISFLAGLTDSAMVDETKDIDSTRNDGLPASFVPNRNQIFLTLAHTYAQLIGAQFLVLGVCQTDYSGYPDCRNEWVEAIESATNLGSGANIKVVTPLMYLTKAETFALADRMGALESVIEFSHTCYKNDHKTKNDWGYGCGDCAACNLRRKGYEEFRN